MFPRADDTPITRDDGMRLQAHDRHVALDMAVEIVELVVEGLAPSAANLVARGYTEIEVAELRDTAFHVARGQTILRLPDPEATA